MATLKILKMPNCDHCNKVEQAWNTLKGEYPSVQLEVVDLIQNPGEARKYGITSTPGIVINDKLAHQGTINEERLRKLLAKAV